MNSEKVFFKDLPRFMFLELLKVMVTVKESPLIVKSKAFALDVIQTCKKLRVLKCESALINQFLRSGTSIGANIRDAFYAHGKAGFVAKLQIALN